MDDGQQVIMVITQKGEGPKGKWIKTVLLTFDPIGGASDDDMYKAYPGKNPGGGIPVFGIKLFTAMTKSNHPDKFSKVIDAFAGAPEVYDKITIRTLTAMQIVGIRAAEKILGLKLKPA